MSYPHMRRFKQALSREECLFLLETNSAGTLSLITPENLPYGVPMTYALDGNRILFHCARTGFKLDALHHIPYASFCVIDTNQVWPEELATNYRSVIAAGPVKFLEDPEEKAQALDTFLLRYLPGCPKEEREKIYAMEERILCMLSLEIEHLSGKRSKDFKALEQN